VLLEIKIVLALEIAMRHSLKTREPRLTDCSRLRPWADCQRLAQRLILASIN